MKSGPVDNGHLEKPLCFENKSEAIQLLRLGINANIGVGLKLGACVCVRACECMCAIDHMPFVMPGTQHSHVLSPTFT